MELLSLTDVSQVISMNANLVWYSLASAAVLVGGCSSFQASASVFCCEYPGGADILHQSAAGY